ADCPGAVPDQHRMAVPDGRPFALVRDAAPVVPAGFVRLWRDVGGGGCERSAGEPVLSQLWADERGDAGDGGGEFAGDPAGEGLRLCDVRRSALAAGAAWAGCWCRRDRGDWLANPWLRHLTSYRFRQLAVLVMLFGGLLILWQQRGFLSATLV